MKPQKSILIPAIAVLLALMVLTPVYFCAQASGAGSPEKAYLLFQQGSCRRALEEFKRLPSYSSLDYYFMARSYQKLRDYTNALLYFDKIVFTNLPGFVREVYPWNVSRTYLAAFSELKDYGIDKIAGITNTIRLLSPSSPFFNDVYALYLFYHWKTTNSNILLAPPVTNDLALSYRRFGLFLAGSGPALAEAVLNYDSRVYSSVYREAVARMTNVPSPVAPAALDALINQALEHNLDLAARLVEAYYTATKDADYRARNLARVLFKRGKSKDALEMLAAVLKKGIGGVKTTRFYLQVLSASGPAVAFYQAARDAYKRYGMAFASEYLKALDRQDRFDEMEKWFLESAGNADFRRETAFRVFKRLLQDRPEGARRVVKAYLKAGKSNTWLYYQSLFDHMDGREKEAYEGFLNVALNMPFTWEWLVSGRYEKALRGKYSNIFHATVNARLKELPKAGLEERLYLAGALEELDGAMFSNSFKPAAVEADRVAFTRSYLNSLPVLPLTEWERLDKLVRAADENALFLNEDYLEWLERGFEKNSHRIAFAWRNRDLFNRLALEGLVVTRLNYYLLGQNGSRSVHGLFSKDVREALYPTNNTAPLIGFVSNKGLAYWFHSAFREESHFRRDVGSWAGAVGYAQIMPATGEGIKAGMGRKNWSIYDFEDNLSMGAYFLNSLFRGYKTNAVKALAAYNAGDGSVSSWTKKYGRYTNELWVECIRYEETREYVKKISLTRYFYNRFYSLGLD